jgi:hypothetical protein
MLRSDPARLILASTALATLAVRAAANLDHRQGHKRRRQAPSMCSIVYNSRKNDIHGHRAFISQ